MRTLLHLFADLLHSSKKQPYSFQAIPHSLSKNLGVGGAPFLGPRKLCLFVRCQTKLSQPRAEACLLAQGDGRARSDCSRKVLWFGPCCSEVTFRLEPGQVLGYLGPNGSGKSTTVKVLTGLLQPTRGQVLFEGQDIQSDLVSYRKRLGYVPEEANLYPFLTGEEY